MILQALNGYYERLESDPDVDIAPFGYSRQKISFCVVLNDDGTLHEIAEETDGNTDKPRPKSLIVLGGAKPSGAGINPCFLWDNTGYMLGFKPDDDKPERTLQSFEAFRKMHLELKSVIVDPEFGAVCSFLQSWRPENAAESSTLAAVSSGFGVFRIRGTTHYVHQRPAVKDWWNSQLADDDAAINIEGQCLLTGQKSILARLHEPKIKGVNGAQSSGAALVSFNDNAYESFGREQSFNAPVSKSAAFQYCTALNHLLRQGGGKIQIGDATTVYWTESPSPMEEFFSFVADPAKVSAEDEAQKQKIQTSLQRIVQGESVEDLELGDGDTPFYVLGLSPNAARLSIRFWYVSTLTDMVIALRQHFNDLAIVRSSDRDPEFPAIWQLLRETVRDSKDIPPVLSGAVMRAILTDSPYPQMLFSAVLRRIRADRVINSIRAGMLKACLNRNSRTGVSPLIKDISMSLDPDRPEPAYQLGRLFAELEKTQEDALPGINATIKDRYFGAASATPASVFPRIIRGSQHHLGKLEYRSKIHREKQIQEICGRLNGFPSHLNLNDQGLFALGYYHQRQAIFTKKSAIEDAAVNA
jgi:CRISPR-associated protein Csd1